MDAKKNAWVIGMLLLLATIAMEVREWSRGEVELAARKRHALISLLNVAAALLLVIGK